MNGIAVFISQKLSQEYYIELFSFPEYLNYIGGLFAQIWLHNKYVWTLTQTE